MQHIYYTMIMSQHLFNYTTETNFDLLYALWCVAAIIVLMMIFFTTDLLISLYR